MSSFWHYIHHNMFDVTSRWETFKFDIFGSLLLLLSMALLALVVMLFDAMTRKVRKDGRR